MNKRYQIKDGVLTFNPEVEIVTGTLSIPSDVYLVDFNNVKHIVSHLNLSHTEVKVIDFKNVISVKLVALPNGCKVWENLYWAEGILGDGIEVMQSPRVKHLGVYDHKPMIYLSGTVRGYLDIRAQQRDDLISLGYGVYSPGNHITFGDPVAEADPLYVYQIDMRAMHMCSAYVFDLTNLSPGTCAELGYVLAHPTMSKKPRYLLTKDHANFFIKGLIETHAFIPITNIKEIPITI